MKTPQCYGCKYRMNIPGDAHSKCSFDFWTNEVEPPKGSEHGIKNGWFFFPFNYDPRWMISVCKAREEEENYNE